MAKDTQFTIRMDTALKEQAAAYAATQGRTLTNLIEWLLRQELKKEEKNMERFWVILDYKNGNKSIMSKTQYEKEVGNLYDYDEAVAGIVESEKQPTWLDLEYDSETRQYYLIDEA